MAGTYTPEQIAHDDDVRREVAAWRDTTPEERLAVAADLCRMAYQRLAQLPPDQLERALVREPLPADSLAMLAAIRKLPR